MARQEVDDGQAVLLPSPRRDRGAEDALGPAVMRDGTEEKAPALLRPVDRPSREAAGHLDDVLLRVPAVDTQGVKLQELARVVLVEPAPAPSRHHQVVAGAEPVVEVE